MKIIKILWRVALFLFILNCVFLIHEYGHFQEYQKRNIPIEELSLGMGPRLYQYQIDPILVFSVRIFPIGAYVKPVKIANELFNKQGSVLDKVIVYFAGVRNNIVVAGILMLCLQIFGLIKGNLSAKEFIKLILVTPFKIICRFFVFLIGCVTWGRVNLVDNFLLSTGGINPSKLVRGFVFWNLVLAFFNLAPILPLDGGRILNAFVSLDFNILGFKLILFLVYWNVANRQDMRLLEGDTK